MTETDDCTKILIGLTAIGFYDEREGLKYCLDMLKSPTLYLTTLPRTRIHVLPSLLKQEKTKTENLIEDLK